MRAALLALIATLVIAAPERADAFRCSRTATDYGASLIWQTRHIDYFVATAMSRDITDDERELAAIRAGFDAWNAPDCSDLELAFAGLADNLVASSNKIGPNQSAIVFLAEWPYDPGVIAVTTDAYDPRTGVVFDADIELNDESFNFVIAEDGCADEPGNMDLENVITHEAGHVVGLDHPAAIPQNEGLTMYPSAPPCETDKRTLEKDDILGLCTIYPAGQPTQQCFLPDAPSFLVVGKDDGFGGCGCRANTRGGSVTGLALFALFLVRKHARLAVVRTARSSVANHAA